MRPLKLTVSPHWISTANEGHKGQIALLGVILGGGLTWPLMKIALADISPDSFLVVRLIFATCGAFFVAWITGCLQLPKRAFLWPILSVALLQMGAFLWLITIGVSLVSPGRAALLAYTSPFWVIPMAFGFLGERVDYITGLSLTAGLSGLAVLFLPSANVWSNFTDLLGNILLLLAAVVWALQIVLLRWRPPAIPTLYLLPWQLLVATILSVFASSLVQGANLLTNWTWPAFGIAGYAGLISTTLVFWGMLYVSRTLPAMMSTIGFLGVPIVGLISSVFLIGEKVDVALLLGFGLIMTALYLQSARLRNRPK